MKALLMIFALGISGLALADEQPQMGCKADVEKFCAGVQPGEGRIVKCLKEHDAELSAECKAHKQQIKAEMKELHAACHQDAEAFCAGKKKHELMMCMRANKDKVSEACKKEIQDIKNIKGKGRNKKAPVA